MYLQAIKSYGNRFSLKVHQCYSVAKEEVLAYYNENTAEDEAIKDHFSEKSLSFLLLCLSISAFVCKGVHHLLLQGWFSGALSVLNLVITVPFLLWTNVWNLRGMALPILSGLAMTVITWYTAFLDRYIPGVFPPTHTSISSKENGMMCPVRFHLGYMTAVLNGVTLAVLSYVGYGSSQ